MRSRIAATILAVMIVTSLLGGCTSAPNTDKKEDKLQIVCTIFPIYDWVREILGEQANQVELKLLMENGADLHNYQPSVEDIVTITNSDLFIYVGGTSDVWVQDVLKQMGEQRPTTVSLLSILGERVHEEELVEGMEGEEEHDHEEAEHEEAEHEEADHEEADHEEAEHEEANHEEADHEHGEGPEYDEHVWLSVKNAIDICSSLKATISALDSERADIYEENTDKYIGKLQELDTKYEECVVNADYDTLIFGDRFPFRYMTEDYKLSYYAAFIGCSAETEAAFSTITFLAKKADELKVPAIVVIETSDQKIAKTIIENTSDQQQRIVVLNSIQSVSREELEGEVTYLSIMNDNCEALRSALYK